MDNSGMFSARRASDRSHQVVGLTQSLMAAQPSGSPAALSTFKARSNTIVDAPELKSMMHGSTTNASTDIPVAEGLKENNKYLKRLSEIDDAKTAARKLEILKLAHMSDCNPDYTLTRNTNFTLFPEHAKRRKGSEADLLSNPNATPQSQPPVKSTPVEDEEEICESPADLRLFQSIRAAEDVTSLFTQSQLSSLTLEQKMLAGMFKPKIKKDPDNIEFL